MEEIVYLPDYFKPINFDDLQRIGKPNDGGYVVRKQDIIDTEHLISLGISFDWSFEKEFYKKNKKYYTKIYLKKNYQPDLIFKKIRNEKK